MHTSLWILVVSLAIGGCGEVVPSPRARKSPGQGQAGDPEPVDDTACWYRCRTDQDCGAAQPLCRELETYMPRLCSNPAIVVDCCGPGTCRSDQECGAAYLCSFGRERPRSCMPDGSTCQTDQDCWGGDTCRVWPTREHQASGHCYSRCP